MPEGMFSLRFLLKSFSEQLISVSADGMINEEERDRETKLKSSRRFWRVGNEGKVSSSKLPGRGVR